MFKVNKIVWVILGAMLVMLLGSAARDSAIMDELAHIPAGFGYITQHDYRLNPEHPPLLKALAALSGQIFVHPYFPTNTQAWRDDVNGQWTQGDIFLYGSGNDADKIIFWSRLPLILLTVLLAGLLFFWIKKRFNETTAFITLVFFAFSPTILTHGRFVTTDVGAAFGFFIGLTSFIRFIEKPNPKNIIWAGLGVGLAQLLKFSLVLLVPIYGLVLIFWSYAIPHLEWKERFKTFFSLVGKTILIGVVGILLIWATYFSLGYKTPQAKQLHDTQVILSSASLKSVANLDLKMAQYNFTRPLGQYLLGVLMVTQRAAGGNSGYFMGEVSSSGWRSYFPILYLFKEPLALHILALIALILGMGKIIRSYVNKKVKISTLSRFRSWIYNHPAEFTGVVFIVVYWASSLSSPLNIGVRHILPTLPFIYLLIARQISDWLKNSFNGVSFDKVRTVIQAYFHVSLKYFLVIILLVWLVADTFRIFPNFMSYYNELAGGPANGYKIAVDSNYDWGQDLIRLQDFVNQNKIDKISVDYFGGGNPRYYLGDKFIPWNSTKGYTSGWYAVSASIRTQAFGTPIKGFNRDEKETYNWLQTYSPVARAGSSIFIYKLP